MQSIDPTTGAIPENPLAGFLPPDNSSRQGEGYVVYTVKPKSSVANGTTIYNQASIVFDLNAAIQTNQVTNTIDSIYPTSSVNPLPATTTSASFPVSWTGTDPSGAGIATYDIFVATDNGPYTTWLVSSTLTTATFSGSSGHSYSFYSVATDNVGNRQQAPLPAQTTTVIVVIAPTITFTVPNHTYGDAPFTVAATSNSSGAITYSLVSGPATVSGSTVTVTGAGTVVVQASQAAASGYAAGTQTATFTVPGQAPTISFTVPNHTYGDAPFTVSAASNSTGAITYSVVSGPATISGSTVTLTGAGTVVLQASQVAAGNYASGAQTATFTEAGQAPTITFTVPNHTYGDAPFTVSATSNSSGAITYSVASGSATLSGSTVTLTGVGTVVLTASQAAAGNYAVGTQSATFSVAGQTPTITFTVPNHTFGDAPFTVSAASNSSGAITYSVVSGPATISGSTITLTGAGTVVLQASQVASGNYASGTQTAILTVAGQLPTINFTVPNHTYGDPPFTVSAASNSSGAITYSVISGSATISGST
jgi:hypothetical protein